MGKKLLFIDGDKDHAAALKAYLECQQYEVTRANTSKEVLDLLDNTIWDIILANPFITGDIVPHLNSVKQTIPVVQMIIFSPKEKLETAMDFFGTNANQYLEFPVNRKALDIALFHACQNISMNREIDRIVKRSADFQDEQTVLNQLFEEVPCYISVQDENLRITAANKKFTYHFGSGIGGFCYEIYKHRTSQCPDCPVVATFKDGKLHSTEEIVTSKFGKQYNVLTQTAPIRDEKGRITQVMEMSTNITQIRQLQDHLISLGLMLGSMSHGVKGMLTGMDGGIYQLETGLSQKDDKRVVKAFGQIKQMADKIKQMVLEILFYAKSRELQYQKIGVADLAKNVVSTIQPMAEKKTVRLNITIPDSLGRMEVDPIWLEAALVNFLENAMDACSFDRDQNKTHQIEFTVHKSSSEYICFTIRDNGIGMDAETKNKMFSLFFTSKGSQGTGLGLFIAHRVITYHGGTVEVESRPVIGSIFTIIIPIQKQKNGKMV